jgi:pimeloyl-ACP methyl ester carboxylesterase
MSVDAGPVETGPASFHVEVQGDGPPLLLIQGLGYAVWAWREQIPALSRRWRVIAFDNRGTGRSFKPPGPYSLEMLADDAAAVLHAHADEPAHVLGISLGGYVAITLALRHPELVRSLVLGMTSAGGADATPVPESTTSVWLANAGKTPEEYARATMWLSFAPGWSDEHPREYEELLRSRLEHPTPPECWRAQYDAGSEYVRRGAPVDEISVPTLVIHGDADRIVPVANGRVLARRLPEARLVELPGRGHLAFLEAPDEFNNAVVSFLEEVERQ